MTERVNERLRAFYLKHLHENEATGYACTGNARLIIEEAASELGLKGDIYELRRKLILNEPIVSHSYVVLETQNSVEHALNQSLHASELISVGFVKRHGKNITKAIMSADMSTLG